MDHLNKIVEQILDFARSAEPRMEPLNVNASIEDLRLLTRHKLRQQQIELVLNLADSLPRMPKTIDFTVDYLRSGLPRDAYARARVNRSGRRYASVHVEAWQDNRARLFAQATGHFLMAPIATRPAEPGK